MRINDVIASKGTTVITARSDQSVADLVKLMTQHRIGAVGAFAVGALVLGEPLTPLRIAGVGLVASGLIVLKLASSH